MKRLHDNRGVALILTILVVSLIVGFTIQFNTTMYNHVESSRTNKDDLKALYAAKSGVQCALALLKADDTPEVTTLFELKLQLSEEGKTVDEICEELGVEPAGESEDEGEWDDTDWGEGGSDDTEPGNEVQNDTELSPCSLGRFEPMENCKFEIIDECGKIQLNSIIDLVKEVPLQNLFLESYLRQFGLKQSYYEDMDAAFPWYEILDWIDPDKEGRDAWGASDVDSKDGPLFSVQELRLIEELSPERLQEVVEEASDDYGVDGVDVTGEELFNAIVEHFTTFSSNEEIAGKININTASREVLISLLMLDEDVEEQLTVAEEQADAMVQYRCGGAQDNTLLTDPKWYRDAGVLKEIEIPEDLITTKSDLFRIISTGSSGNLTKRIVAIAKRETKGENIQGGSDFRIIYWSVE